MTSISLSKLKSLLPFTGPEHFNGSRKSKNFLDSLDPEVGFEMTLVSNQKKDGDKTASSPQVPELHVKILGARHLPSIFGMKTVQGYVVKIKLFPGSVRYDTSIQTTTWPTFNEIFKFPLEAATKSSFKSKNKHGPNVGDTSHSQTLPEKLFKGHFLVLTVFALLELPPGLGSSFKDRFQQIRRKSSLLRAQHEKASDAKNANDSISSTTSSDSNDIMKLTSSEARRNIGSVTCFLDPKMFEENSYRTGSFVAEEMWMSLKDITATQSTSSARVTIHPKGQIEMVLRICDSDSTPDETTNNDSSPVGSTNRASLSAAPPPNTTSTEPKSRWSLNDMRKKLTVHKRDKPPGLCLKISTTKMRCSIKVKEEFENMDAPIYVKTTVFQRDAMVASWKSDQFAPSLSIRWDAEVSTILLPFTEVADLKTVSIKTTVATKTKMGKKIILGTLLLGENTTDQSLEHWQSTLNSTGTPVTMWHPFQ